MTRRTYSTEYNKIPLVELDRARKAAKAEIKAIEKRTGIVIKMRTFYFGPRRRRTDQHVLKAQATGAKLGFYQQNRKYYTTRAGETKSFDSYDLIGYY